jgi:hypothetical protein
MSTAMKMEAEISCETLISIYLSTRHRMPDDATLSYIHKVDEIGTQHIWGDSERGPT